MSEEWRESVVPIAAIIIVTAVIFYLLPYLATLAILILFFLPYFIAYQIKFAAERNDLEKLADYVNFPELRQNLSEQAKSMMTQSLGQGLRKNVFVIFGLNLANVFTEKND